MSQVLKTFTVTETQHYCLHWFCAVLMEIGDVAIYSRNSFHDLPETSTQIPDYHPNIPMDDAASEVDNTLMGEFNNVVFMLLYNKLIKLAL